MPSDRMRQSGLLLSIPLFCLALGACSKSEEKAEIKLGAILATTGALSTYGTTSENALLLAQKEINAAGGVLDRKIALEVRDSQNTASVAVTVARELIDTVKVPVILGLSSTPDANEVIKLTAPAKVVTVVGGASYVEPGSYDGYLFRTVTSVIVEGRLLARHVYGVGVRKMAVLSSSTNSYSTNFGKAFQSSFAALSDTSVSVVDYVYHAKKEDVGAYDYGAILDQALASNPEAIFLAGYEVDSNGFLQAWNQKTTKPPLKWYLADPMKSESIAKSIGVNIVEGIFGAALPAPGGSHFDAFKAAYLQQYNQEPNLRTWNMYDALYVTALAIAKAGNEEGPAIRDAMRSVANAPGTKVTPADFKTALDLIAKGEDIDYEGASGPVEFDADGEVLSQMEIWKYAGGVPTTVTLLTP